jgi:hypothetical protein
MRPKSKKQQQQQRSKKGQSTNLAVHILCFSTWTIRHCADTGARIRISARRADGHSANSSAKSVYQAVADPCWVRTGRTQGDLDTGYSRALDELGLLLNFVGLALAFFVAGGGQVFYDCVDG